MVRPVKFYCAEKLQAEVNNKHTKYWEQNAHTHTHGSDWDSVNHVKGIKICRFKYFVQLNFMKRNSKLDLKGMADVRNARSVK